LDLWNIYNFDLFSVAFDGVSISRCLIEDYNIFFCYMRVTRIGHLCGKNRKLTGKMQRKKLYMRWWWSLCINKSV